MCLAESHIFSNTTTVIPAEHVETITDNLHIQQQAEKIEEDHYNKVQAFVATLKTQWKEHRVSEDALH